MSTIYYCDAASCNKKEAGRPSGTGWVSPDGWSSFGLEDATYDACSEEHADAIVAASTPVEEEAEEEAEAEDS